MVLPVNVATGKAIKINNLKSISFRFIFLVILCCFFCCRCESPKIWTSLTIIGVKRPTIFTYIVSHKIQRSVRHTSIVDEVSPTIVDFSTQIAFLTSRVLPYSISPNLCAFLESTYIRSRCKCKEIKTLRTQLSIHF